MTSPDSLKKYPQYADLRDFIEFSIAPWAWEQDAITNMAMKPSDFKKLQTEFSSALNEISRLREALEFYADIKNWEWNAKPTDTDFILNCGSDVQRDFGRIAQQALSANQGEK